MNNINKNKKRISKQNYEEMINSLENTGFSTKEISDIMSSFSRDDLLAGKQSKRSYKFEDTEIYVVKPHLSYSKKDSSDNNQLTVNYYNFK